MRPPRINAGRLRQRHGEMARIGAISGGGCRRLALTPEDAEARDLFRSWTVEAGLDMRVDGAGNMFALRSGRENRAFVGSGSHLDTQPHGGRFDGISGVLCALEVMETLNDAAIETRAPLAAVNWTNEEGVRFAPGLMGSSWFTGRLSDADLLAAVSADGVPFAEAAQSCGYRGDMPPGGLDFAAFFELHIEQGPVLEREAKQIGVVDSVQGLRWLDVSVRGMDAHAGTTPMDKRQDTLQASARILVAINELGRSHGPEARVSVGVLKPHTEAPSTIAGQTDFIIDIRHPDAKELERVADACRDLCLAEARSQNCRAEVSQRIAIEPVRFDPGCVEMVASAANALGLSSMRMPSGALHDASNMAALAPTAMIFIPCKDGISHNVRESASDADLEAGCNVLLHAMLAAAGVAA